MKKKNKQHKKHQSKRKGGTQNYMNQNYMNKKNKVYVWLKGRNLEARGADGFIIHICGGKEHQYGEKEVDQVGG